MTSSTKQYYIRGIEYYNEDEWFTNDESKVNYWGVFDHPTEYAYYYLATFQVKEDAELFLKIKQQS